MTTGLERMPVVDTRHLFLPERQALLKLLATLTTDQWQVPTICDGWTVHDVALHLLWVDISNISRRRDGYFGRAQDNPVDIYDLNTLIRFVNTLNSNWTVGARRMSPELLQTMLSTVGKEFSDHILTVDIEAIGDGVGWAGPEPEPIWLDIGREFTERWVHQQHIRDAIGVPGATEPAFLGPVLSSFAMALPYALREVDSPPGTTARLTISGNAGGSWVAVRSSSGWSFLPELHGAADSSLAIDQDWAWRLFTKGITIETARSASVSEGDHAITDAILHMVTILA
jgi:uncharacterized protein (TIGR03083 family)